MGELRFLAVDAARAAFGDLRGSHPAETFYVFALTVAPDGASVAAAANTEEALMRTAERFAADGYGSVESLTSNTPASLRWRVAEWGYREVGAADFAEVNAFLAGGGDPIDGALTGELVGALRDLNREDFFGWGPERDAVVLLIVTDDPADLLELARDVNPATPFARLQEALG